MRLRRLVFVGAFVGLVVTAGVFGACTLNPQPLPPEAFSDQNGDGAAADGGAGSTFSPGEDASATVPVPSDANGDGRDAGDASDDGGDAADASDDAD